MKKWGFLLLLLCLTFINIEPFFEPKEEIQAYENGNVVDRRINESLQKLEITEEQIYQGSLLLVNREYPVHPKGIKSDVINLYKSYLNFRHQHKNCHPAFTALVIPA